MKEKIMPQNVEAEQCLLGSILIDDTIFDQVSDILHASDFYRDAHRTIYEAMARLNARGVPPDFISLLDELTRLDKIESVGGTGYLASLSNSIPTSGNAVHYARTIAKKAEFRRLVRIAGEIAALGYEEEENALEQSEQLLFAIRRAQKSNFAPLSQIMSDYMEELQYLEQHKGSITGVTTGYDDLDILLQGLQKSDLDILAARPGMGKTSLALCMAYHAARKNKNVAIFSLEMGSRQLARRLMSMDSKLPMQDLRGGWIDWETAMDSFGRLSNLPIWINDTAGNPVSAIRSQLRTLVREQSIDVVMVDYLQLIEAANTDGKRHDNRVQEISAISRGLKQIAREFDVPVLALAQLSRQVEQRQSKIPQLSDLKESGAIEENADVVMFLYRDDYYADSQQKDKERPGEADIIVAKHRNGPTGTVTLRYQADQTMFYPLEKREPYDY